MTLRVAPRIKTARADRPAGGRGRSRRAGARAPRESVPRPGTPRRADLDPPASAPVGGCACPHRRRSPLIEAAPLQRLEIGGERGPVHGQQGGDLADAGRLRTIERHHQGELAVGQGERPERLVDSAAPPPAPPAGRGDTGRYRGPCG